MGLTHISPFVKDTQRTLKFYQRVFGVEEMYHSNGLLQVTTPGSNDIIVFEEEKNSTWTSGGIKHFGFRLEKPEDIEHAEEVVTNGGGVITEQGEFVPDEPYVFFKDPDGYEVEIWYEKLPEKKNNNPTSSR